MTRAWLLLILVGCASSTLQRPQTPVDPLAGMAAADLAATARRLRDAGDLIRAEQYLMAAIERGYPEATALPLLIEVCLRGSRYQTALRHADAHLSLHPGDWATRYLVASLHHALDEDGDARRQLERVIAEQPDQAPPRFLLALILSRSGTHEAAERELVRYLELAPTGPHADEARARLRSLEVAP